MENRGPSQLCASRGEEPQKGDRDEVRVRTPSVPTALPHEERGPVERVTSREGATNFEVDLVDGKNFGVSDPWGSFLGGRETRKRSRRQAGGRLEKTRNKSNPRVGADLIEGGGERRTVKQRNV